MKKLLWTLWILVVGAVAAAWVFLLWDPHPAADYARYSLIHMPKDGRCPAGFTVAPKVFNRGGSSYDGCLRVGGSVGGGMIDEIGPGESVEISIPLQMEPEPLPSRLKLDPDRI